VITQVDLDVGGRALHAYDTGPRGRDELAAFCHHA